MEFHKELIELLRAKGYAVESPYIQAGSEKRSGHLFIVVNGVSMPIETASEISKGRTTLAEVEKRFGPPG